MGIISKNKPFFIFLLKFGLSYIVLTGFYWLYLSQFDAANFEPDGMTTLVANQSRDAVQLLSDDEAFVRPRKTEASYRFFINGKSVARIVEGCNAISVMILFTAFIVAFSAGFKKTVLYIIAGIAIMHLLNVIRVALLCLGFYHYPEYKTVLHDIIFPLFIYGVVFVLWIIWVLKFSAHAKKA